MYLSRMYLNRRRRGTRDLVANPQKMHAAVMSAFPPGAEDSGEGRVLWRLDRGPQTLALYVVSPTRPSFEHLQEQAGWANEESWAIRDYAPVLGSLSVGKRFSIRVTANPVRTVTGDDGKKRRCAHVTAEQQRQWLLDRAEHMGVRFLAVDEAPMVTVTERSTMRFKRGDRTVTIARVQFDAACEVIDAEKLRHTLVNGVGKAKGYGCGLITLAPYRGLSDDSDE